MTLLKNSWLFFLLLFVGCKSSKNASQEPQVVTMTTLSSGYFLRNDIILNDRIHCMVATSQSDIDEYFGYGAVMGDNHMRPDFGKNYVLAMVVKAQNKVVELAFQKVTLHKGNLRVQCLINEKNEDLGYEATPVILATIKRSAKIKTVSFYDKERLIRRVVM
ncbi:MAG: hypothetical protein R2800_06525 [Flavipsychrobacter sp.]